MSVHHLHVDTSAPTHLVVLRAPVTMVMCWTVMEELAQVKHLVVWTGYVQTCANRHTSIYYMDTHTQLGNGTWRHTGELIGYPLHLSVYKHMIMMMSSYVFYTDYDDDNIVWCHMSSIQIFLIVMGLHVNKCVLKLMEAFGVPVPVDIY